MGYGIPASIGVCLGSGKRKTICVDGDGGLQLNIQNGVSKTGGGLLVIDTPSISYPTGPSFQPIPITISGGTAPTTVTPWVTSAGLNLVQQTDVSVSNQSFGYALPALSVTTFVGTMNGGGAANRS